MILEEKSLAPSLERQIRVVLGLCRKANRVATSARLFVSLNSSKPTIDIDRVRLRNDDLVRLLLECALDHELLISSKRGIRIVVDRDSLDSVRECYADPGMIQQAIHNLLDNAAKFSFPRTVVSISTQRRAGMMLITVTNCGIPIHEDEISHCVERGWQGETAKHTIGEGSGIGLWVAEMIMKAHQGSVIVSPTDPEDKTQVHLAFPVIEDS